jgi:hypothetical protein
MPICIITQMNATLVVGSPGASTASTLPPKSDIFALLDNDLSQAFAEESAQAAPIHKEGPNNLLPGLDATYMYPSLQGTQVVPVLCWN